MGGNLKTGFGFNAGGGGGGTDTNTNIANADLTLDGNHTTDVGANTLTFDSGAVDMAKFNGTTNKITFGPSGDDYTFPDERPGATGDVLSAADTSGTLEWTTPTDTNTNIANTNLTLDNNRITDVGVFNLTFDSGTQNIMDLDGADDSVSIGGSSPYKLPTQASGSAGNSIQSTNATNGTAWKPTGFNLPFTMYLQGLTALNTYHYPEPMSNNKFLALTRSSGLDNPANWNIITSTTLRSCTLGGNARNMRIGSINGWVSVLDNSGSSLPTITVEIWKITPSQGATTQLVPTSVISCTSAATGDSNNKFYLLRGTPVPAAEDVSANDLLMPVYKVNDEAADTGDLDVWINAGISCYYT